MIKGIKGKDIANMRKIAGLSQFELALKTNMSINTIARIEQSDYCNLKLVNFLNLMKEFHVKSIKLVDGEITQYEYLTKEKES